MEPDIAPVRVESLKEACIRRFEELILSGAYRPGDRLPSERDCAQRLGVSRPVVHEAVIDLAVKGLLTLKPRKGVFVNDFRTEGSLALLVSLVNYRNEALSKEFLGSILEMRSLFETETCRCAARRRTESDIASIRRIVAEEASVPDREPEGFADVDYRFHHAVALASGNLVYPLLLNSFKTFYVSILARFYTHRSVIPTVIGFHGRILSSIEAGDAEGSAGLMRDMLLWSERTLLSFIGGDG